MNNVLVTGGAGFIGSNFIHFLLGQDGGLRVVNLDALTYAGSLENLRDLPETGRYKLVQADIRDRAAVTALFAHENFDTVVHFAAESHVDRSIFAPGTFVDTNIVGTFNLLEAARAAWQANGGADAAGRRFLHISTDEVYGSLEPGAPAFTEQTPYAPNSPYAASKAASDHLVRAYGHTYGLPMLITNCSNNYGPRQFPEKLIPLMILNALEGKPLPIYGDGGQIRDWLYVDDHCRALLAVLGKGRIGETYCIGGGNQPTNLELVKRQCQVLDDLVPDSPYRPHVDLIEFVPDRPGHDRRYAMDTSKIQEELGWRPDEDLTSGLGKTVGWFLDHPDWVAAIRKQPTYQAWIEQNYTQRGSSK